MLYQHINFINSEPALNRYLVEVKILCSVQVVHKVQPASNREFNQENPMSTANEMLTVKRAEKSHSFKACFIWLYCHHD